MDKYKPIRRTPPLKILRNLAIVVAAIMAFRLISPLVTNAIDERRARAEILYDFDFIMDILVDNFPYFPMIYRRTGIDMPAQIPAMRARLADRSYPVKTVDEFEQFLQDFFRQARSIGHLAVTRGYESMRPISSEENLHTEIIEEGRIAYLRVSHMHVRGSRSGHSVMDSCRAIVNPFFQEIGDFEHLVLDIRGNSGGIGGYFQQLIMEPLFRGSTHEESFTYVHHFIRSGEYNESRTEELRWRASRSQWQQGLGDITEWVEGDPHSIHYALGFKPFPEYVLSDLLEMDFHFVQRHSHRVTSPDRLSPFDGKIWLLVDEGVASAAQLAALLVRDTGFATVVGNTTRGVASFGFFVTLPNTGIMIRYDPTYTLDRYGRPLEYGILPHYFNREGMDALETVLAMIAEMDEITNYELLTTD